MERIVRELGGIGDEEAVLVVQIAKSQHALFRLDRGYVVTRSSHGSRRRKGIAPGMPVRGLRVGSRRIGKEEAEIRRSSASWTSAPTSSPSVRFKDHRALRDLRRGSLHQVERATLLHSSKETLATIPRNDHHRLPSH